MWERLQQQLWQWRGIWTIAPTATLVVILLRLTGLLQSLELDGLDMLFRLRPKSPQDERILIVGISEQDLQQYGHPINDRLLAEALDRIVAGDPRAIGLDIYRDLAVPPSYHSLVQLFRQDPQLLAQDDPIEPGYERLTQIYRDTEQLIGIAKVTGGVERVAPPPVLASLDRIAANDLARDEDGKLRRGFFYLTDPETEEIVLSLGFKLAVLYLEPEGIQPKITEDDRQWIQLDNVLFEPLSRRDGGYAGFDDSGYQFLINYRGAADSFETLELSDILEDRVDAEQFRDRIVLIGYTAESLKDFFDTPFSSRGQGIEKTAGVEVHANITSHILSATLDGRSQIRTWSDPVEWTWIFLAATIGASLSWTWRYSENAMRILGQICAGTLFVGVAYVAFLQGWWIPIIPPLIAQSLAAVGVVAYVARSAADIRHTFSRYLTDEVVATLLETPEGLSLGGERRQITILTSDLRGFTSISERLPPEQVVSILNIYLEAMADAITAYQGTIDEFMGDGILVLFGAPTQREDDAERAIACAVAMQKAMKGVNEQMAQRELPNLEMGIGINTGEVVVGNIGSLKRTKYGVVGSQVNLTYRIESYTVGGQILVTEQTIAEVDDIVEIDSEEKVSPKGVVQPITVYSVVGIGGKYDLSLERHLDDLKPLDPPIEVVFSPLEGKHLSDRQCSGQLMQLSPQRARVQTSDRYPPLTNIRFRLHLPNSSQDQAEFYAKVVKDEEMHEEGFGIRMTAVPPEVTAYFQRRYEAEMPSVNLP